MSIASLRERPPIAPIGSSDEHASTLKEEEKRAPPDEPSPFAKALAGLGDAASRGERDVGHALGAAAGAGQGPGRELSAAELLSVQASVYRYGEVIDVASKLVDHATGTVKTVMQGQ